MFKQLRRRRRIRHPGFAYTRKEPDRPENFLAAPGVP